MIAAAIAAALGQAYRSASGWWNTRCPVCCGDGKLGLKDSESGLVVHCLRGCLRVDVLAQIDDLNLAGLAEADPGPACHSSNDAHTLALDIWRSSATATSTCLVAKYFASRGLDPSHIPLTIREISITNPYAWHLLAQERRPVWWRQ